MPNLNFDQAVIAHRGANHVAPENTIPAFAAAYELGIKWLECDVTLSQDGVVVIIHDDTLDRTTNGTGKVISYPYAALRKLDAGAKFSPPFAGAWIPALSDLITFLNHTRMSANIEIKELPARQEELVKRVLQEMQPILTAGHVSILFSSFSVEALRLLRQQSSDCQISLLLDKWRPDWAAICQELQCVSVGVDHNILTLEKAQEIKAMGKFLLCYTVNDPARAKELYAMGVDAVFSDTPDRLRELDLRSEVRGLSFRMR